MDIVMFVLVITWVIRLFVLMFYLPDIKHLAGFFTKAMIVLLIGTNLPNLTPFLVLVSSLLVIRDFYFLVVPINVVVHHTANSHGQGFDLIFEIDHVKFVTPGIRKISGMPGVTYAFSLSVDNITFYVPAYITKFQIDRHYDNGEYIFILKMVPPWYFGFRQFRAWKANIPYPDNEIYVY